MRMRRPWSYLRTVLLVASLTLAAFGQQSPDIASRADIIFRGEVLGVTVDPGHAPGEVAFTRITVRVDDAVRGVSNGQMLTIRQWQVGADEYRVGESLVLFLHRSSDLGLSSPVGGRGGHRRPEEVPSDLLATLHSAQSEASVTPIDPPRQPAARKRLRKLPPRLQPLHEN